MANTSKKLTIAGFGPLMMGGYRNEPGILPVACTFIEKRLSVGVQLTNISLGFPFLQQNGSLTELVSKSNADYIVFESAPLDARPPIGRMDVKTEPSFLDVNFIPHLAQPTSIWNLLRRVVFLLIEFTVVTDPLAPVLDYLAAVTLIAGACKSVGVSAVVLSPFCRGSHHSTGTVSAYRSALRDLAKVHDIILVDCVDALRTLPKSLVSNHDGRCLSWMGQEAIGWVIAEAIVSDARLKSFKPLAAWTSKGESHQPAL